MTTYILVIWTLVSSSYSQPDAYAWRIVGEFQNEAACERAGELLTQQRRFRCLPTK